MTSQKLKVVKFAVRWYILKENDEKCLLAKNQLLRGDHCHFYALI